MKNFSGMTLLLQIQINLKQHTLLLLKFERQTIRKLVSSHDSASPALPLLESRLTLILVTALLILLSTANSH
jgi:hypothetical protein